MMEVCLFWAPVILPNCVFPPSFPPYFRCGSYLDAGSRRPITVHILTSTQPVTSGKTDGKLLTGMKNHFDTAEFSSQASSTQTRSKYNKI